MHKQDLEIVKELILIRHAEAESTNFDVKDRDRALIPDGEVVASKTGRKLAEVIGQPDLIIASAALRTRQTASLIAEQLQYNPVQIEYSDDLFEASTRILMSVVNQLDETKEKVIMVAHNPGLSFFAEYLTGEIIGNVAAGGAIHLRFKGLWSEFASKNVELVMYYKPAPSNPK